MRYLVDLFGGTPLRVSDVTAGDALDLALLGLESPKAPRGELIHTARVYRLDQDGKVVSEEGKDAA